jgi:predicted transcriptional regulator
MSDPYTPNSRYQHTQVTLRLPCHILERVDKVAIELMTSRSSVLRQILAAGAFKSPTTMVAPEPADPNI